MKLPKKVRIGVIEYEIIETSKMKDLGLMNSERSHIKVKHGLEEQQQVIVVFHEAAHAMIGESGVKLSDETEEVIVSIISAGFFGFLRDNPEFVDYFSKNYKR